MGGKARLTQSFTKIGGYRRLAMDQKDVLGLGGIGVDPAQKRRSVGVGGKAMEPFDLGPDDNFFSEQLDPVDPIQQDPAQAACRLEADKHDGTFGPPKVVLQVMADPARITHAAGGKNDLGGRVLVEKFGLFNGLGQVQPVKL